MPRKPDRPFSTIKFSPDGGVSQNLEHTDLEKEELELRVAQKFVTTLNKRGLHDISNLDKAENEPADITAQKAGELLMLQLTESVHEANRVLQAKRHEVIAQVEASKELRNLFRGWNVSLATPGEEWELEISKDDVLDQLKSLGKEIRGLDIGKARSKHLNTAEGFARVHVLAKRVDAESPAVFFPEGGMALTSTNWLLETIRAKVDKRYSRQQAEFWLVVYSNEVFLQQDRSAVQEVAAFLDTATHPFSQVWYFLPMPNAELGDAVQIWPKPEPAIH